MDFGERTMTVKELIEQIEMYPDAIVNIGYESVFTNHVYVEDANRDNVLISEKI